MDSMRLSGESTKLLFQTVRAVSLKDFSSTDNKPLAFEKASVVEVILSEATPLESRCITEVVE